MERRTRQGRARRRRIDNRYRRHLSINPKTNVTPAKALELAIEGETHEYTDRYPGFRNAAVAGGNTDAGKEYDDQIAELKEHAAQFRAVFDRLAA